MKDKVRTDRAWRTHIAVDVALVLRVMTDGLVDVPDANCVVRAARDERAVRQQRVIGHFGINLAHTKTSSSVTVSGLLA